MTNLAVDYTPPDRWVERLRPGHGIWLVKEKRRVDVAYPWDPPEPGHIAGRLVMDFGYGQLQRWYVKLDGRGMDGSQLILPLEAHLPENPDPVQDPEWRAIRRRLAIFEARLSAMEKIIQAWIANHLE